MKNMFKMINDEEMCKVSGGDRPEDFTHKMKVECPVCGTITEKNIAVCNCDSKWWGSHMFVKSLCKQCEIEYRNGTLESKVEFMPQKSENPKEPRVVIGLKKPILQEADIKKC